MVKVSDHAVLRYLERVVGIDIAAIRAGLQSKALDAAATQGCPVDVRRADGVRLRVVDGVVVTVMEARPRKVKR